MEDISETGSGTWKEVGSESKSKRPNPSTSETTENLDSSPPETNFQKKSRIYSDTNENEKANMWVYLKGTRSNIVQLAKSKPIAFKRSIEDEIGDMAGVKFTGTTLRITCRDDQQKRRALLLTSVLDIEIEASKPFMLTSKDENVLNQPTYKRENKA